MMAITTRSSISVKARRIMATSMIGVNGSSDKQLGCRDESRVESAYFRVYASSLDRGQVVTSLGHGATIVHRPSVAFRSRGLKMSLAGGRRAR